ncbi:HAD family hydrolase [Bacillus sp. SCS-151]|uniref:HAD family hydrolase n=1 Tax=Nanhaiella sioensis TaxID=3115293 RepID=UPI00397C4B4D
MGNYKVILFDLDGTLSDPKIGITKSVQYALKNMNIVENDLDKLECFIGPPLQVSFADYYHFDEEKIERAIELYRERFKDKGMFENVLYPNVPRLLSQLKEQNYKLVVATSKPTVFAEKIINYFHIEQFFDLVVGSNLDGSRASKTEIIQHVLDEYNENELNDFIMIGDRKHDIIGANNTGIDSIGVTYGYGSFEELSIVKPTYIANNVEKIREIFLANKVI